jgi:activator of HSP90 ATPase
MAKWGEGDARWKVEDMGVQGRNVNSWHWEETNALPWATDRLTELLGNATLVNNVNGSTVRLDQNIKLTGDAIINQRKGKLIPAYELDLSMKWKGSDAEGATGEGEVKVPYISEENHDEDPEVQVTATNGGAVGEKMRNLIVQHGRPLVHKAVATFVKELWAGGPVKRGEATNGALTGTNGAPPSSASPTPPATTVQQAKSEQPSGCVESAKPKSKSIGGSVTITEEYFCSPKDLYDCFTDMNRIRAYTGSSAEVDPRPGGKLSMFGGSVEGAFRELDPPRRLELDWRFSSWPDGVLSIVSLEFEEKERGATTLRLRQSGIPDCDRFGNHDCVGMTQAGWKQQVLLRIRKVFGYGA